MHLHPAAVAASLVGNLASAPRGIKITILGIVLRVRSTEGGLFEELLRTKEARLLSLSACVFAQSL
jgi:hypothetical protein